MKACVIGLDGACWEVIERYEKSLPNLSALRKDGASGGLRSVIPPYSAPAWASFMTGCNPGKHGIYGFKIWREGTRRFEFVSGSQRGGKSLWEILSERGKRVLVINVPMTYPAREVNGILIAGMDSPGIRDGFCYPEELREEIVRRFPGYRVHLHLAGYLRSARRKRRAVEEILDMLEWRRKLALYLLEKEEWELAVIVFSATDRVQHYFWRDMEDGGEFGDAVRRVYEAADGAVGELLERTGGAFTVIMSDHGAGPFGRRTIYLAEWLRRRGYLRRSSNKGYLQRGLNGVLKGMRAVLPSGAKDYLIRALPGLRGRLQSYAGLGGIEWSRTRAFFAENTNSIRINSEMGFPDGVVKEDEYEPLREELIEGLSEIRDPVTGQSLLTAIYRREELYHGPRVDSAPDIYVVPGDFAYATTKEPKPDGSIVEEGEHKLGTNGVHRLDGIVAVRGSGVKSTELVRASILDIAPTVLHALGEEVPRWMDGKVLDVFRKPTEVRYSDDEVDWTPPAGGYSETDASEIQKRLRGLGYVE